MEIHDGLWLESKPGGLGETFRARKSRVDSHSVVDTWCLRRVSRQVVDTGGRGRYKRWMRERECVCVWGGGVGEGSKRGIHHSGSSAKPAEFLLYCPKKKITEYLPDEKLGYLVFFNYYLMQVI